MWVALNDSAHLPAKKLIPRPAPGDSVDMRWALSTADSLWSKGDRVDAIRWVQRAAQAASDAELDGRALELAKVAAELSSVMSESQRPPPNAPLPSIPAPVPAIPVTRSAPPEFTPIAPAVARRSVSPAALRPSNPPISNPPAANPISEIPPTRIPSGGPPRDLRGSEERVTAVHAPIPREDDDDWEEDTDTANKSLSITASVEAAPDSSPVDLTALEAPKLKTSQAVRVVLWRDGSGVHIAPHGTVVSAITIDAMVVAIHPDADLASWLSSGKKS